MTTAAEAQTFLEQLSKQNTELAGVILNHSLGENQGEKLVLLDTITTLLDKSTVLSSVKKYSQILETYRDRDKPAAGFSAQEISTLYILFSCTGMYEGFAQNSSHHDCLGPLILHAEKQDSDDLTQALSHETEMILQLRDILSESQYRELLLNRTALLSAMNASRSSVVDGWDFYELASSADDTAFKDWAETMYTTDFDTTDLIVRTATKHRMIEPAYLEYADLTALIAEFSDQPYEKQEVITAVRNLRNDELNSKLEVALSIDALRQGLSLPTNIQLSAEQKSKVAQALMDEIDELDDQSQETVSAFLSDAVQSKGRTGKTGIFRRIAKMQIIPERIKGFFSAETTDASFSSNNWSAIHSNAEIAVKNGTFHEFVSTFSGNEEIISKFSERLSSLLLISEESNRGQFQILIEHLSNNPQTTLDSLIRALYMSEGAILYESFDVGAALPDSLGKQESERLFSAALVGNSFSNRLKYGEQLVQLPKNIQEKLTLTAESLKNAANNSHLVNLSQISFPFPEMLQSKIASSDLTPSLASYYVNIAARNGSADLLRHIGGTEFSAAVLAHTSKQPRDILDTCLDAGWHLVDDEIKNYLLKSEWPYMPSQVFATKDTAFIGSLLEKMGNQSHIHELFDEMQDMPAELAVLKAGCSRETVQQVLNSDNFKEAYPEHHQLATTSISFGEQALIVRTALRQLPIETTRQAIALAQSQGTFSHYTSSTTYSFLTGLHEKGIYFEQYAGLQPQDLDWEKDLAPFMSQYLGDGEPAALTKEGLLHMLASFGDFSQLENIFFLLDSDTVDREEDFGVEDYRELLGVAIDRNNANPRVLQELVNRAEIHTTDDWIAFLSESMQIYPTANGIRNTIELSNGLLGENEIKAAFTQYMEADGFRKSGKVIGVFFDYMEQRGSPFSEQEKLAAWNLLMDHYEQHKNARTVDIEELTVFDTAQLVSKTEYTNFLKMCLDSHSFVSGSDAKVLEKLLKEAVETTEDVTLILRHYMDNPGLPLVSDLKTIYEFSIENGVHTSEVDMAIVAYLKKSNVDYSRLSYFIDSFPDLEIENAVVVDRILEFARTDGVRMDDSLQKILNTFSFSVDNYRTLAQLNLEKRSLASAAVFRSVVEKAQLSREAVGGMVQFALNNHELYISKYELRVLLDQEVLATADVYAVALNYLLHQPHVVPDHKHAFIAYLRDHQDADPAFSEEKLQSELIAQKPEYGFFKETELIRQQRNTETAGHQSGFLYDGLPAIDINHPEDARQDSSVYYRTHLCFSEAKGFFSPEQVRSIIGDELSNQLDDIKATAIEKVLNDGEFPFMVDRERATSQFRILGHGTGQASARKKGLARSEDEVLDAQSTVQKMIAGPDGIYIAGEKATIGSFMNPATKTHYGSCDDGTMVLFLTEDMLRSHISISDDPGKADGLVGRDKMSGKYVQIPNRVLFSTLPTSVMGTELNSQQIAGYIMQLQHELDQNPELVAQIEGAALAYEQQELGPHFAEEVATIHLKLRERGYPEGAILWARDFYTTLAHSNDEKDSTMFKCLQQLVRAVGFGTIDEDIRGIFDNVHQAWDFGLAEFYQNPAQKHTSASEIIDAAEKIMNKKQRTAFREARKILFTGAETPSVGVGKQYELQVAAAEASGAIPTLNLREKIKHIQALFVDSISEREYRQNTQRVKEVSVYMESIKNSVLRTVFSEAITKLEVADFSTFAKYADNIALCSSGSVGRGEVVISSDLDYLVLIDDSDLQEDDVLKIRKVLAIIGGHVNTTLEEEYLIRPDAGLANKDRQPIVLLSTIQELSLHTGSDRQTAEPSEILDATAIYASQGKVVEKCKRALSKRSVELRAEQKTSASDFFKSETEKFATQFNGGISQFLSRDQLVDFKMQVQRAFNFKIYELLMRGVDDGVLADTIIPSRTDQKIDLLRENNLISDAEAASLDELVTQLYRLRFRSDVLNAAQMQALKESGQDATPKVVAKFDPRTLSTHDVTRIIGLLTDFEKILTS